MINGVDWGTLYNKYKDETLNANKIDDELKEKKEIEKIILCDLQNKIYPGIEKKFFKLP